MNERKSQLQNELAQRKPFRSLGHEAVLSVLRTSDVLKRRFGEIVAMEGLTNQQYNVLRILRGAEPEGLPMLTVAERMLERTPGITGLVDRLTEKGLVKRIPCREDRRRVICRITPQGLEVLARLDKPTSEKDDELLTILTGEELESLIVALDKIRSAE